MLAIPFIRPCFEGFHLLYTDPTREIFLTVSAMELSPEKVEERK
jgi:hypothetical protein